MSAETPPVGDIVVEGRGEALEQAGVVAVFDEELLVLVVQIDIVVRHALHPLVAGEVRDRLVLVLVEQLIDGRQVVVLALDGLMAYLPFVSTVLHVLRHTVTTCPTLCLVLLGSTRIIIRALLAIPLARCLDDPLELLLLDDYLESLSCLVDAGVLGVSDDVAVELCRQFGSPCWLMGCLRFRTTLPKRFGKMAPNRVPYKQQGQYPISATDRELTKAC